MVKNPPAMRRPGFDPVLGISPGGGHGNPLQYSCLEKPHGQRSLVNSPWGHKESDMTEQLSVYSETITTIGLVNIHLFISILWVFSQ